MSKKTINHPMEQIFDLEPGSTLFPATNERQTFVVDIPAFDDKDKEIEQQFQEVYDIAMDAFDKQAVASDLIEPKFRARNEEVAVQYLNTALAAAREKLNLKQHKDKMVVAEQKAQTPSTVNQNLIVADRNELLRTILNKDNQDET